MHQFGFVETVDGFSEGVDITGVNAADGWFDASFGQSLCVSNGQILPAVIRVMDQSALLDGRSIMQCLFQRIENQVCLGGPRDPPAEQSGTNG